MTKRPGISLIEQIVTIVIMTGMVIVMVNILISTINFQTEESGRIVVGESAARILATLDDTLREGRVIAATATVNGDTYTTGDDTLVVHLPSVMGGVLTNNVDTVVVRRNPATRVLEQLLDPDPSSDRLAGTTQLATDVNDVYFRYTSDDPTTSTTVTVVMTTDQTTHGKTFSRTTLLNETLRNHP